MSFILYVFCPFLSAICVFILIQSLQLSDNGLDANQLIAVKVPEIDGYTAVEIWTL